MKIFRKLVKRKNRAQSSTTGISLEALDVEVEKQGSAAGTSAEASEVNAVPAEVIKLRELDAFISKLISGDHYIAKSEYLDAIEQYKSLIQWFQVLKDSGMLEDFCRKNGVAEELVSGTMMRYKNLPALVDSQNEQFIKTKLQTEKDYLDNILKESDPEIKLDDDQRRVVLTDEDYCLVVAGAGAGKTTTVAAKVRYLVERQGVDPKQILVISFTNKAVNELKQRIIGDLHIECPIATFHSTGNAILHKQNPEKLNIADQSKLYYVLQNYFRETILKNESTVNNLILFFASYFDAPYEGQDLNEFFNHLAKANYSTMRSELDDFEREVIDIRSRKSVTIQSEVMRSGQEVEIANFLYLNGIDYEYEPLYRYDILFSRKPYTPDFIIRQDGREAYLEHFGITQDGRNNRYSHDALEAYKRAVNHKISLHKRHGTKLIYTFSAYDDRRPLTDHLQEQLARAGFELRPRPKEEIIRKLVTSEENRYIRKLVTLTQRFITNFKTNGYTAEDFNRMYHSTQNVRTRLFLNICNDCYLEYERYLKENNAVDFQDMINESARILREVEDMKQKLDFKYVIVDEYQDISRQRFDLVTALRKVTDAKIVAVGDDWQSIYAFSGSDITLFTKFAEKMGYAKLLKIVRTYRNSQEVIDIAGSFIQKNREQIQKDLISPKHIENPVIIYTYDSTKKGPGGDRRSGVNYAIAHAVEVALDQIVEYNRQEKEAKQKAGKKSEKKSEEKSEKPSILLIGRFGFDGNNLERAGDMFRFITRGGKIKSEKYPQLDITFLTAHSSKGLGYDNVIVINGRNETYGFPSKIEDDPVLSFVVKEDRSIEYAEERRLFYVALTRTKNRVFFIAPEQNPSEFLLELKQDYKNVVLSGEWNEDVTRIPSYKKICPMCGYPMQYRYKPAYGLRLYICTNEPEVCGFMTNKYEAGKLSIIKCDQCRDGYLIVKPGRGQSRFMLGCTNYKRDGTGCSRIMSPKYFCECMGIKDLAPAAPAGIPRGRDLKPEKRAESSARSPEERGLAPDGKVSAPVRKPKGGALAPEKRAAAPKNAEMPAAEDHRSRRMLQEINEEPGIQIMSPKIKPVVYKGEDLNLVLALVLQTLLDISEKRFYGTTVLVNVLRGSKEKKLVSAGLNKAAGYGKLSWLCREDAIHIIEWLIRKEYILKTKGKYPVLHSTHKGKHYGENITSQQLHALRRELEKA